MTAIQLSLWGTMPGIIPTTTTKKDEVKKTPSAMMEHDICPRDVINSTMTLDPCRGCPLKEVCGDDCGMKLYDIDSDGNETITFTEWLSEPLY